MLITLLCSLIVGTVFIIMSFSYTHKRADRKFATNKQSAPSISSFRNLSKVLFVSSMLLTLLSYWSDSTWLLQAKTIPPLQNIMQLFGASMVLLGYLKLRKSFADLGDNYSPLFDACLPFKLITTGNYAKVRHPIYLYNLFVSFGLAVSSMSVLVLINALIGLGFILKTIQIEEHYLSHNFPEYDRYKQRSWRLIPYVY